MDPSLRVRRRVREDHPAYKTDVPYIGTMTEEIPGPERMRQAVADYVTAAHRAYLSAPSAGGLPLLGGEPFSVLAVGTGELHLIATRQPLPPPQGPEVEIDGDADGLRWRLRFFDPMVVPELARVPAGPAGGEEVRRVLGISSWLYHLTMGPGSVLSSHHAAHTGVALASGRGQAAP
jgi:hypothetical protein